MKILYDGGYYEPSTNRYYYFVNDYLGGMRTVLYGTNGNIHEKGQYYPFGSVMAQETSYEDVQPYKFSGKEEDHERGLNWYDFHARQYESALGRFTSMDPMAEKYYSWSPYGYCKGNPVLFVDPDGKQTRRPWSRQKQERIYNSLTTTQEAGKKAIGVSVGLTESVWKYSGNLKLGNFSAKTEIDILTFEGNLRANNLSLSSSLGSIKGEATISDRASIEAEATVGKANISINKEKGINANLKTLNTEMNTIIGNDTYGKINSKSGFVVGTTLGKFKVELNLNSKAMLDWGVGMIYTIVELLTPEIISDLNEMQKEKEKRLLMEESSH